ncbi:MAG: hypothetical protein LBR28_06980 [Bacteroidales bacterium]|nr:hypothetical protein [Bacteroidales bacterium]
MRVAKIQTFHGSGEKSVKCPKICVSPVVSIFHFSVTIFNRLKTTLAVLATSIANFPTSVAKVPT